MDSGNGMDATGRGRDEFAPLIASARRRVLLRAFLLLAVLVIGGWFVKVHWTGVSYFMLPSEPVRFGDVREMRARGVTTLPGESGTYARLENLLVTHAGVTENRRQSVFFCPVFNVLVRTSRDLPEQPLRSTQAEVPEGLEYLIEKGKVYADDFMRRFDAEGMLLRVDDVSGSKTGLREYLTKEIGLPESETGAVWVMLDGEAPVSRLWDFAVSVAALLVLLGAAAGLLLAVRARNRVVAASRQAL